MDTWTSLYAPLVGRILMGGFFLWNGIQEILNLSSVTGIFIGFPQPVALALLAATIEVLGGIALVVGFKTRLCASLLTLYVLATTGLFIGSSNPAWLQLFLQNMAVVGGLLYISAFGSGLWSPDRPHGRKK